MKQLCFVLFFEHRLCSAQKKAAMASPFSVPESPCNEENQGSSFVTPNTMRTFSAFSLEEASLSPVPGGLAAGERPGVMDFDEYGQIVEPSDRDHSSQTRPQRGLPRQASFKTLCASMWTCPSCTFAANPGSFLACKVCLQSRDLISLGRVAGPSSLANPGSKGKLETTSLAQSIGMQRQTGQLPATNLLQASTTYTVAPLPPAARPMNVLPVKTQVFASKRRKQIGGVENQVSFNSEKSEKPITKRSALKPLNI